jgi:hypothetical protein
VRDPFGPERESGRPAPAGDRDRPVIHDHLARSTPTVRIVGRDRWPVALAGLIGLFLIGALVKPRLGPGDVPPAFEPAAGVPSAPDRSIGPDLLAGLRDHCQEPLGWRVYSREIWLGRPVRTWRSVEPVNGASGPADPAIPIVPLGPAVDALGYCSPWTGPERPPDDARVSAWHRDDAARGGDGLIVAALRTIAPDEPTALGALFGGLPQPGAASRASAETSSGAGAGATPGLFGWPAGRYVFVLRAADWERWWAVQVARPDGALPGDPRPSDGAPAAGSASP